MRSCFSLLFHVLTGQSINVHSAIEIPHFMLYVRSVRRKALKEIKICYSCVEISKTFFDELSKTFGAFIKKAQGSINASTA